MRKKKKKKKIGGGGGGGEIKQSSRRPRETKNDKIACKSVNSNQTLQKEKIIKRGEGIL